MGIPAAAVAVSAASSIAGGLASSGAAGEAGAQGMAAAGRASDTQLAMYNNAVGFQKPYYDVGTAALTQLGQLYGIGGDAAAARAQFTQSPDYQFALDQGTKALDRSAASKGMILSGGQVAASQRFGQGLATQQFGNYWNRLAQLAGFGQHAADVDSTGAISTGTGQAQSILAGGQAQMAGTVGSANALSGGFQSAGNQLLIGSLLNKSNNTPNNTTSFPKIGLPQDSGSPSIPDFPIA